MNSAFLNYFRNRLLVIYILTLLLFSRTVHVSESSPIASYSDSLQTISNSFKSADLIPNPLNPYVEQKLGMFYSCIWEEKTLPLSSKYCLQVNICAYGNSWIQSIPSWEWLHITNIQGVYLPHSLWGLHCEVLLVSFQTWIGGYIGTAKDFVASTLNKCWIFYILAFFFKYKRNEKFSKTNLKPFQSSKKYKGNKLIN